MRFLSRLVVLLAKRLQNLCVCAGFLSEVFQLLTGCPHHDQSHAKITDKLTRRYLTQDELMNHLPRMIILREVVICAVVLSAVKRSLLHILFFVSPRHPHELR